MGILVDFFGDVTFRMFQNINQLFHLPEEITSAAHPLLPQFLFDSNPVRMTHVRLKREWQIAEIVESFVHPTGKQQHTTDRARQRKVNKTVHLSCGETCDANFIQDLLLLSEVFVEGEHEPGDCQCLKTWLRVLLSNHLLKLFINR